MRLTQRMPAIVVLHDLAIQELMIEAVEYGEWEATAYLAGMEKWYGPDGAKIGQVCLDKGEKGSAISDKMPGFELALEKARAVLIHTDVARDAVQARLPNLPCSLLPLPFEVGPQPSLSRAPSGPLRLLQFGWIGPNRRLEQVLDVLAQMPEDFDYRLDVMGKIWNPDIIHTKLALLDLGDRVHLHGFVPEPVLDDALRQAHLVLNLRHPSMGEASGSQLRIWNAGAASAVTRTGWYASLREDVAYGIDLEEELAQLHALFEKLAADRHQAAAMGRAGYAYLKAHHTPETYVEALVALVQDTVANAGQTLMMRRHGRLQETHALAPLQQDSLNRLSPA
jgi:glycosyltransferase involved in cell wall biosynthesis